MSDLCEAVLITTPVASCSHLLHIPSAVYNASPSWHKKTVRTAIYLGLSQVYYTTVGFAYLHAITGKQKILHIPVFFKQCYDTVHHNIQYVVIAWVVTCRFVHLLQHKKIEPSACKGSGICKTTQFGGAILWCRLWYVWGHHTDSYLTLLWTANCNILHLFKSECVPVAGLQWKMLLSTDGNKITNLFSSVG